MNFQNLEHNDERFIFLIQLATLYIEDTESENWSNIVVVAINKAGQFFIKIIFMSANCILANKVRNVNSIQREHLKSIQDREIKKI